ncbi:NAD(P)/FAD-dependent oxidoreductase [Arthrobacter sp. zg-Y411]|uniref:NAD(P)/FAD-dependent oxidoreductase n=1 Tax=Arthrobacter zhangbolii TaxID=2886936 RepID=UPI001D1501B4|nr:NAD(P)/FAD-dependent oxidoreductase [Arthrobacter zhangbolii]MCC3293564.1 NAD(P)/FAD-dependent oxidoreductase [Arthrobacter zhangbolii]
MTQRRIVVVGNGIAGLTACDALRAGGFDGELTVVGAETHRPYSRPALSKALLHGGEDLSAHELPAPTHGATEMLGESAAGLDPRARVVRLDSGGELPYDGLVIASGSRARRLGPAADDGGAGHEVTLRTFEDALRLKRLAAAGPSVVVVGGGPLGMEVASGCLKSGCRVTLVSDGPPLSRQLGGYLADIFATAATRQGLRIISGGGRAQLERSDAGTTVLLADGSRLEADLVVTAAGDIPNTEWLAGSGLLTGGTLQVDSRGRVRPDIVAAGDVASFPTGRGVARVPLWTSAIDQAKVAAAGLLHGQEAPELAFQPYFWTEAFGLSLKAVGFTPVQGAPGSSSDGPNEDSRLMWWGSPDGAGTAVSVNYRIPVPKLRRLASQGPGVLSPPVPVRT